MLHQYYLTEDHIGDIGDDVFFFGAPDFETRDMLNKYNFIFGGHSGDSVAFVYKPVVDSDLTSESYGTINLASFYLNMMKATEELIYVLADDRKLEKDEILFKFNAKEYIQNKFPKTEEEYGKNVHSYAINEDIKLVI
jgi:hypothetical protein